MAAPSLVQDASGSTGTASSGFSITPTLSAGATAGNIIVLAVSSDATFSTTLSGWTLIKSCVGDEQLTAWYRTAAGNETSFTGPTITSQSAWWIGEFQSVAAAVLDLAVPTWTTQPNLTFTTTYITPSSGTTTIAATLVVAVFGTSRGVTPGRTLSSCNNSFTVATHGTAASNRAQTCNNVGIGIATRSPGAIGSYNTTGTFSGDSTSASGIFVLRGIVDVNITTTQNAALTLEAQDATITTTANIAAENAAVTLAAQNATVTTATNVTVENAAVTLAAQDATVRTTANVAVENAAVTLAAQDAVASANTNITTTECAAWSAVAQNATLTTSANVAVENAVFTLAAYDGIASTGILVVDASSPSPATASNNTVTTDSFTPPAGSLLVALTMLGNGAGLGNPPLEGSIEDSLSQGWTLLERATDTAGNWTYVSTVEVWCRNNATSESMTVTYTAAQGLKDVEVKVLVLTGAAATAKQIGATNPYTGTAYSADVVTTTIGSLVVGCLGRSTNAVTVAGLANTTDLGDFNGADGDTCAAFRAASNTTSPGSTTFGYTHSAGGANCIALAEILPLSDIDVDTTQNAALTLAALDATATTGAQLPAQCATWAVDSQNITSIASGNAVTENAVVALAGQDVSAETSANISANNAAWSIASVDGSVSANISISADVAAWVVNASDAMLGGYLGGYTEGYGPPAGPTTYPDAQNAIWTIAGLDVVATTSANIATEVASWSFEAYDPSVNILENLSGPNYGGTVTDLGAEWVDPDNAVGSNDNLYATWTVP